MNRIETKVSVDREQQAIHLETSGVSEQNTRTVLAHRVVALQDKAIRDALIELGWAPPDEKARLGHEVNELSMRLRIERAYAAEFKQRVQRAAILLQD